MAETVVVRRARGDDAGALIDHTKIVGGESDNLTFGSEGIQKTVEQERELIESLVDSSSSIFLVAVMEGQIVGTCNFNAFVRHKRISTVASSVSPSRNGLGERVSAPC